MKYTISLLLVLLLAVFAFAEVEKQILDPEEGEDGLSQAALDQQTKYLAAKNAGDLDGCIKYALFSWVKAWALNNKAYITYLKGKIEDVTMADAKEALVLLNEAKELKLADVKQEDTIDRNIDACNWVLKHRIEKEGVFVKFKGKKELAAEDKE